ncbi:GNAT family N-acetyltransferase [Agrococcus jejuensis]|uniref:Acetyltransferase (GNAT) family protein n=1 Tax=Agrococcus jejuensis TaxID=399736 RepID=A0A1G8BGB6_9MICO|nr:GNAT family N-acetyltransferase [Agrococcus jejuensis]SDH32208.1 Acetyltransferase (GNAT) family protein [Agrococcus jejuensis]
MIPSASDLPALVAELAAWQRDDAALQLHPGDLGWQQRLGAEALAGSLRTWHRDGALVALGMLDGPVLRIAIEPHLQVDVATAEAIAADLADGLAEASSIEASTDAVLHDVLAARGWTPDEAWQPLRRDLAAPVPPLADGLRIELVDAATADERVAVHRASFDGGSFDTDAWHAMAAGPAYADARCLLVRDAGGTAVAAATVWSAGAGRPGVLEPLGAHRDHRGRGLGTAIAVASAIVLRDLGASSALVCTPSSNVRGIATYRSAGFADLPERTDRRRPA